MAFVCSVEPQPALMAIYCQSSVLRIYHDPGIQSLAWWYKIAMIVHSNQIVLGNRPVREEEPKFEGRNCTPFEIHAAFFRDFEPVCFCVQYCSSPGSGLFAAMVAVCSFSRRYLICQSSTRYKSHFPNFQVSRFSSGLSHAHLQCAIQDVARFQLYTHTWKDIRNTMMTWHAWHCASACNQLHRTGFHHAFHVGAFFDDAFRARPPWCRRCKADVKLVRFF